MWENILIILIVALCLAFLGRRFFRQIKGGDCGCSSSCSGCDTTSGKGPPMAGGPCCPPDPPQGPSPKS